VRNRTGKPVYSLILLENLYYASAPAPVTGRLALAVALSRGTEVYLPGLVLGHFAGLHPAAAERTECKRILFPSIELPAAGRTGQVEIGHQVGIPRSIYNNE